MRILYVEDNPANLSLMLRIARMGNHEIVSYTQGEQALENFQSDKPDLILLDLQLAGQIGGVEVMTHLRARAVQQPIIAVTAYAMVGDRERCLQAGFTDYMAKPLQVGELVDKIQRYNQALSVQRSAADAAAEARHEAEAEAEEEAERAAAERTPLEHSLLEPGADAHSVSSADIVPDSPPAEAHPLAATQPKITPLSHTPQPETPADT